MIDVIIPAYNAEKTIGRALASILAQTRPRKFLVTVVDDCSTDNTKEEVMKFSNLLPIQYIKLEENKGKPGLVRNIGIQATSSPYILFLDSDDMLAPTAAEVLSRAILQYQPEYINSAFYQDRVDSEENMIISTTNLTWLHGNIYSRNFLKKYNIEFDDKWNEDGSFNLKCYWLAENKKVINEPMAYWMHNTQSVTRGTNNFLYYISYDYILTYVNAIEFILKANPKLSRDKGFHKHCAGKLAEFFLMFDGALYKKIINEKNIEDYFREIRRFKSLLEEYSILNVPLIKMANEAYNTAQFFTDAVRQQTFKEYCKDFNILWTELEG